MAVSEQGDCHRSFESIIAHLDQGIALFRAQEDGSDLIFEKANPCFAQWFAPDGSELAGMRLSRWSPGLDLGLSPFLFAVREEGQRDGREVGFRDERMFHLTGLPLGDGRVGLVVRETTEEVRTRRELSRSNARFRALVEDTGAFFCEYGPGGVLSYVNKAYCDLVRVQEEDILGKDFYRFIPPDQREQVRAGIEALSPEAPSHSCEHQVRLADGSLTWQRWIDRAFFDERGSVLGCSCVGLDITAEKEAEEARQAQAQDLEALFEVTPIAVAISHGHLVRKVNPAFCGLFGFEPEDVIGRDMREVLSRPGTTRAESGVLVEEMDRGESAMRDTVRYDREGREVPVRIIGVSHLAPDGKRTYFAFFQDLTDTLKLEREVQRNLVVIERSPVVIFEAPLGFGAHCRFISENVSQFGYDARDLMEGKVSLDMRTHPEDMERIRREVAEEDREGRDYREYTFRLLTGEGKYRWVNERNRVLRGPEGDPESIIGVLIDQSELIWAQKELQDRNEKLGRHAREMEKAWEGTILLLAGVTEMRDPYTRGHQARVAHLCGAIGHEMGFDREALKELVQAAHIHDIGKMEVPSDYLNRPGALLAEEFDFICDHPAKGYELLSRIRIPGFLPEIVYQHHERLDGSGYPRGLLDGEILLSARVLAVADVVEAMLSHRPYRAAHGLEAVMAEIEGGAGRLYDEDVVAACRRLFLEKGYVLPCPEGSVSLVGGSVQWNS